MHPVLFLSYDGCLHPEGVRHIDGAPLLRGGEHRLFEHAELLAGILEPYPDLGIVLSTPWARIYGLERAKDFLPAALRSRVVGTTHEFCGDMVEWAELTEFDRIMRYVGGHGIQSWLALSCDRYYWPEAFCRNRVWVYSRLGLGEDRTREQLREKLAELHREIQPRQGCPVGEMSDAAAVSMLWATATNKLADARIVQLSASTRFGAAYDAVRSCASILATIEPRLFGLRFGQMLEELPVERHLDSAARADSIALLQAWQTADYWEQKNVKLSDVDVVLKFAEAVRSAIQCRLPGTCTAS